MDEKTNKIEFIADKLTMRGPNVDNGFIVSLSVGEYEKEKIAQLIKLEGNVKVTIEPISRHTTS